MHRGVSAGRPRRACRGFLAAALVAAVLPVAGLLLAGCTSTASVRDIAREYYNLGNAYFELKKYDKAADYYNRALAFDRTLAASRYNLALTWTEAGQYDKAVGLFRKMVDEDPENVRLLTGLAYALSKGGKTEDALGVYDRILALSPFDAASEFNYALLLRQAGRLTESRDHLRRIVDAAPDDTDALYRLAGVEAALEDWPAACGHLESCLAKKADNVDAARLLATCYEKTAFYQKALDACQTVLKARPDDAVTLFMKARMLLTAVGDEQNGLDALDKALAAGFRDDEAISALLAAENLVDPPAVKDHIERARAAGTPAAAPASDGASSAAPVSQPSAGPPPP